MKKVFALISILLLTSISTYAGPKTIVKSIGHEMKMSAVDIKRHPFAWGIPVALQLGIAFADTSTSCIAFGQGYNEVGGARLLIGRHPSCRQAVLLTSILMTTHITAEHSLSNLWTDSCYREAAKPGGTWWKVDAHSHNPESCRWNIPYLDTVALSAIEIPNIHNSINLLERK